MNIQEVCKKLKENARSKGKLGDKTIQCLNDEILNSKTGIRYTPTIEELTADDWEIEIPFEKYSFPIFLKTDNPYHIDASGIGVLEYCFNEKQWNSKRVAACPNKFKVTVEKWNDDETN